MSRVRVALAVAAVVGVAAVAGNSLASAAPVDNKDVVAWCTAAQRGQLSDADRSWAKQCVRVLTEGKKRVDPGNPVPPQPPTDPAPVPPVPPAPPVPPIQPQPAGFPDASNTGIPNGTTLTPYTGPCAVTAPNTVIDAKTVNCDLVIRTTGVQIRHSKINGAVASPDGSSASFTLVESEVDASPGAARQVTGVGADNFTVLRSEIVGGNRGIYCRRNCTVQDSWIHGTKITGDWHASGIRASQGSKILHNTIACDTQPTPQDGGCSADLTMYGDFEAVRDVLVQDNLFVASTGAAFCAYGGSSAGKPFSGDAGSVVFLNNSFQRGKNNKCGAFNPIDSFDASRPGNKWVGNVWAGTTDPVVPS